MEKDFYTELSYRHKNYDEISPKEITIKVPVWDMDLYDFFKMFRTIVIGATYCEESLQNVCEEYLVENGYTVIHKDETED